MNNFLAVWHRNGKPVDLMTPQRMLNCVCVGSSGNRKVCSVGSIALGHQNDWSINEKFEEDQPLADSETGMVITGTIRLDNRKELFKLLSLDSLNINQISDARLLLYAYSKWGVACPGYLMGDFAFIIWDFKNQRLFAARDALGAEEIYYFISKEVVVLADRIAMLTNHPDISSVLNEKMVANYLALDMSDMTETFYQDVFHLPPAHCLVVEKEKYGLDRYWDINNRNKIRFKDPHDYANTYYELISQAVLDRIQTNSAPAISLSGGLDSSSLACVAVDVLTSQGPAPARLRSYSYVFDDYGDCDERVYIDQLIKFLNPLHSVSAKQVKGDLLYPDPLSDTWLLSEDYPFQDPFYYLLRALLNEAQKDDVRLMLSGFFGDDLYSGDNYLFADLFLSGQLPSAVNLMRKHKDHVDFKRDIVDYGLVGLAPSWARGIVRRIKPTEEPWKSWISPHLVNSASLKDQNRSLFAHPKFRNPGQQKRYDALFFTGYPMGITCYQNIAAQFGIKYQFPFFDRRIVEFILALPSDQIGSPGLDRKILRDSMRNKMPEKIRTRTGKATFDKLFQKGIYDKNWGKIKKVLEFPQIVERGWVRQDWLTHELERDSRTLEGFILWLVLSLELWLQHYWHN